MSRSVPNKIDRDKLHAYLFGKANSRGRVTVRHIELAELLGIRSDHLGRILAEMVGNGRMRKMSVGPDGVVYIVKDPATWKKALPERTIPARMLRR